MRARLVTAFVAACLAATSACASSEADLRRTAADPSDLGPEPSAGSGVLRRGFDPATLAPPAPAGAPTDPHAGHAGHGAPSAPPSAVPAVPR